MKDINSIFFASQTTKSKLNYQVIHLSNIHSVQFFDRFACNCLLFHVQQRYFSHAKRTQSTVRPRLFFGLATGGLLLARSSASNNPIKPVTFDEAEKSLRIRPQQPCTIKSVKLYLLQGAISRCAQT